MPEFIDKNIKNIQKKINKTLQILKNIKKY